MASESRFIKQIASVRRKPNMTRKEYFDHRFRIHGAISDGIEDVEQKPHKYIQTHLFDSAYGERSGGPFNSNNFWMARDDVTELIFRDWEHLKSCMSSDYVKEKVGPDGALFADFETAIALLAWEKPLQLNASARMNKPEGAGVVAMLFISAPGNSPDGATLEKTLSPLLITALEKHAAGQVSGLIANIGIASSEFDLTKYFGGSDMPKYALVYKILIQDSSSVTSVRKAQAEFNRLAGEGTDQNASYIVFGVEGLVLDVERNIKFDSSRQPSFADLTGPSHLDG